MNNEQVEYLETENIIDENKLRLIVRKIIELENENVKTKDFNDDAMKKKIAKIIEEEIKCC